MYDIISVAFVLGFFGLCLAYIYACDRILGPDEEITVDLTSGEPTEPADEAVAA